MDRQVLKLLFYRELPFPGAADAANASEVLPIAQFPWNQLLQVQPSYSLAMLGRFLRVGLTFCNEHITDQMTRVVHARLADEQSKLYADFQDAARTNLSRALCIIPQALQYATQRMMAVRQDAHARAMMHPGSAMFQHILVQRTAQEVALVAFKDEVVKRITKGAESLGPEHQPSCSVLMWQEFFGGWMPADYSAAYCEDVFSRWQRIQQSGINDMSPQSSHAAFGSSSPGDGGGFTASGGSGCSGGGGGQCD